MAVTVREAGDDDLQAVLGVHRRAFGGSDEADLVAALLDDPTARPLLSLLAEIDGEVTGHVLFTAVTVDRSTGSDRGSLLAPLAVVPGHQRLGIGATLMEAGFDRLRAAGVRLVFVLGHPDYYPRHGFAPAGRLGFEAPYPIADENADAWMVQALRPGLIGAVSGRVVCCDTMDKPEVWRE